MKKVLTSSLLLILLSGCTSKINIDLSPQNFKEEVGCVKAGETVNYSFPKKGYPKKCCAGLIQIYSGTIFYPTEKIGPATLQGGCTTIQGAADICSNCGNGVCEKWENPCNCSKDCNADEINAKVNSDINMQRRLDVAKITQAIELYNEKTHKYPDAINFNQELSFQGTIFIKEFPKNPLSKDCANNYSYKQLNAGQGYEFYYCLDGIGPTSVKGGH
jgi:hypothetical protein